MLEVDRLGMVYRPPRWPLRWVVQTANNQPVRALESVSLSVDRGEIVGIVGPNGAGKSTLIRAIATLLIPTEGEIRLDGQPLGPDQVALRSKIGFMPADERSFYWRLTGRQNLEYFAALAGLDKATAAHRIKLAMDRQGLTGRDKSLFGYSSGMLARLGVARALLHEPDLLVLDEPTRSLDPLASHEFCDQMRGLGAEGRAVLFASHRLDDVIRACDRIVALVAGGVAWQGSAADVADDPGGLGRRLAELVEASSSATGATG